MNLYRVEANVTVFIAAENDEEAQALAVQGIRSEIGGNEEAVQVQSVQRIRHSDPLPAEWRDVLPWGRAEKDVTCADILKGKWA